MIDIDVTRNDGESFKDFQHRAFIARATAETSARNARDDRLAKILHVERYHTRTIIDLTGDDDYNPETGAYVVEYRFERDSNAFHYWAAIVNGKQAGHTSFTSRALATLQALAHLDGDSTNDYRGSAAGFAARVLGINPDA